jgi:hypothetical protein
LTCSFGYADLGVKGFLDFAVADAFIMLGRDGGSGSLIIDWVGSALTSLSFAPIAGVDIAMYTILAWYLSNVLPNEYGARRGLLFFTHPSYWFSHVSLAFPSLFFSQHLPPSPPYTLLPSLQVRIRPAHSSTQAVSLSALESSRNAPPPLPPSDDCPREPVESGAELSIVVRGLSKVLREGGGEWCIGCMSGQMAEGFLLAGRLDLTSPSPVPDGSCFPNLGLEATRRMCWL